MTEQNFLIYSLPDDSLQVNALMQDETIWLTQKAMGELFDVAKSTISEHLKNVFESGELDENSVVRNFRTTAADGKNYSTNFYNLDTIISVGYRVNSNRATKFRIWATSVLREYMIKGFALDDDRLAQGKTLFNQDYFKELLGRVRSIRASERRIWLQITDIFAECASDYVANSAEAKDFFATIQNRFHYAISGNTAAEIIYQSANHTQPNMGLTTWKNAPDGRILQSDTLTAKNYLSETEIRRLERAVSGFFDYVEDLIENRHAFTMAEFSQSVNKFLAFREYKILDGKGNISHEQAVEKAKAEYAIFNKTQKINSDFERFLQKSLKK
ncbi:RhuM family protein [Lonepinella sp. BR2271]|uniref:virulence RhuM family protein n=1 Tax=Lonepinella sp. BR2271 TaxID=3434550 RepID=UPI003F6DE8C5